jgi:hypothetical protein
MEAMILGEEAGRWQAPSRVAPGTARWQRRGVAKKFSWWDGREAFARLAASGFTGWEDVLAPGGPDRFFQVRPPFRPRETGYDDGTAWWCGELSRWAYGNGGGKGRRDERAAGAGLRVLGQADWAGAQAILVEFPGTGRVLVFRGTSNLLQWLLNFAFIAEEWSVRDGGGEVRVHRGFDLVFDRLWPLVGPVLDGAGGDLPLLYAGHSLGGALANLAASVRPPDGIYTFGCPRVGTAAFADLLRGVPNFRVFLDQDIVAAWPGMLFAAGQVELLHTGAPCHLFPDGHLRFEERPNAPTVEGFPEALRALFPNGPGLRAPDPVLDHAPVRYCRALEERLRLKGVLET